MSNVCTLTGGAPSCAAWPVAQWNPDMWKPVNPWQVKGALWTDKSPEAFFSAKPYPDMSDQDYAEMKHRQMHQSWYWQLEVILPQEETKRVLTPLQWRRDVVEGCNLSYGV